MLTLNSSSDMMMFPLMVMKGGQRTVLPITIMNFAIVLVFWFKSTLSILSFFLKILGLTFWLFLVARLGLWLFVSPVNIFLFVFCLFYLCVFSNVFSASGLRCLVLFMRLCICVWRGLGGWGNREKGHPIPYVSIKHLRFSTGIIIK